MTYERFIRCGSAKPVANYYAYTSDLNFKAYKDEIPRYYLYSWK
jgi:hypothetical protein